MERILKIEELGLFGLGVYLFSLLSFQWWWFPILILLPDIGMLGYLFGKRAGAFTYNLFHHRAIAIVVYLSGIYFQQEVVQLIGVIAFAHAAMDRIFGYGLKYVTGFNHTHLGIIGKEK
ncbi:DUF4260 domain-containing protein [Sungkyunkwania multivorans]|uniref:DUF4260 domain-containing protein n=1 Tax=Sungkyunkwania multivorans TaxID=1173618 RepID=A0ABW3D4C1_9FLAO